MTMIKFEINEFPFALTNDQLNTIVDMVNEYGWDLDYDVVEGDNKDAPHIKLWVHEKDTTPTRIWIGQDGQIGLREDVDWDWKGTTDDN